MIPVYEAVKPIFAYKKKSPTAATTVGITIGANITVMTSDRNFSLELTNPRAAIVPRHVAKIVVAEAIINECCSA